jgi:hypothetical protein
MYLLPIFFAVQYSGGVATVLDLCQIMLIEGMQADPGVRPPPQGPGGTQPPILAHVEVSAHRPAPSATMEYCLAHSHHACQ